MYDDSSTALGRHLFVFGGQRWTDDGPDCDGGLLGDPWLWTAPAGPSRSRQVNEQSDAPRAKWEVSPDSTKARAGRHWFMAIQGQSTERQKIHHELERVRADMHDLVACATAADLRRRTTGTRWTNGQMLWHMAFGFLVVRRLVPLVRLFGRLPDSFSRTFAAVLNAGTLAFHVVNYLGSAAGALVFHGPRLTRQLDHTIDLLHRRLDDESEAALGHRMHFPVGWDPFFRDTMTLEQVYAYGAQHYAFHRAQLTLEHS